MIRKECEINMSENKVALVTGATRGIGKEIALELAKNGFDIAVNCRNKEMHQKS